MMVVESALNKKLELYALRFFRHVSRDDLLLERSASLLHSLVSDDFVIPSCNSLYTANTCARHFLMGRDEAKRHLLV